MHNTWANAVLPGEPRQRHTRVQPIPNQLPLLVRCPATAQDQRAAGLTSNRRKVPRNGISEFSYSWLRLARVRNTIGGWPHRAIKPGPPLAQHAPINAVLAAVVALRARLPHTCIHMGPPKSMVLRPFQPATLKKSHPEKQKPGPVSARQTRTLTHDPANRAAIICEAFDLATKEPDPATCKAGPC
jgi:hypothetical protein